jgi:hypothetical protein
MLALAIPTITNAESQKRREDLHVLWQCARGKKERQLVFIRRGEAIKDCSWSMKMTLP